MYGWCNGSTEMKTCSVMQPTYLPWAGYFNLIAKSDVFVFLDDAQFQKNSWHNRNRVVVNHIPHWITVPVKHRVLAQKIKETEIDITQQWRRKHTRLLQQVYSKHPFAEDMLDICSVIEQDNITHLAALNISLIQWILEKLNIRTEVFLSSAMSIGGERTTRLIRFLKHLQVDCYLSPKGAMEYLEEDGFTSQTAVNLVYQEFNPTPYVQHNHQPFESHLSIVDVVANIGWQATRQYVV
jgi:hypothetical protein